MGSIGTAIKLVLGYEDSLGKVLAGSSGKGVKQLVKEAKAAGKGNRFNTFVNLTNGEVEAFDKAMNLSSDVFTKKTLGKDTIKALKKESGTFGKYNEKLVKMYKEASNGTLTGDGLKKIFGNGIGKEADEIAKAATKAAKSSVVEGAVKGVEKTGLKGLIAKAGKCLKGKGGTIAIALSVGLEAINVVKAFKNGDGGKQIGRSALNLGGFAAGAAAGAAIGSIIPGAGTAIGGILGGICGFVGGIVGGGVSEKIGNAIFGKSIEDQKTDAEEAQADAQEAQQAQLAQIQNNYPGLQTVG